MPLLKRPILIVEDDRHTSSLITTYLQKEGFATIAAYDGEEALTLARNNDPGFVILDIMLPGVDGWDICRDIRKFSDVPILILTAREEEIDRVMGLSIGADDYVVKPFSPRELIERVKAILRRVESRQDNLDQLLTHKGLALDPVKLKVTSDGRNINLTSTEYKLLHSLMSAPGKVFSREQLLDRLYPHGENVIDRVIDVHIGKLRQKIEKDPADPQLILTVRGFGYRFAEPEED